ncbi:MAG: AzlC family ABC transporter permease [Bacillota bacterium]
MQDRCALGAHGNLLTLRDGTRAAVPIIVGYLPIGMAYGVLACQAGFTVPEVVAMSLIVFAGSSQFIAAGMWATGMGSLAIVATTFLVNLRHALMSAALAKPLARIPRPSQALLSFWITDESFAVSSTLLSGPGQATTGFMAGLQLAAYLAWALGSLLGALVSPLALGVAHLGVEFTLPAMFIALLVAQVKGTTSVAVAAFAAAVSVFLALHIQGNFNVILATLAAASLGVLLDK